MSIADKLTQIAENEPKVYEAGKKAEFDAFWDMFQENGTRANYTSAFMNWSAEYIRPKYKVTPTHEQGCNQMINSCKKLKKIEAAYFDLSQKPTATSTNSGYYYTFSTCSLLEEIEDIGMIAQANYTYAFAWCYKLKTIAKMGVHEGTTFGGTFTSCSALENVTFDGVIGQSISLGYSTKLSADSIRNLIEHLSDTASGKSVTVSNTAKKNAFTDTEWAALIATKPNWSFSLG